MKTKKIKTFVITVSRNFPATHKRAGEPTYFPEKLLTGVFKHETYYLAQCTKCGYCGYSNCFDGGNQIADTGDYEEISCPKCGNNEIFDNFSTEFEYYKDSIFVWPKLHTCRANYELWAKRIAMVQAGEAILSIRYWSGKPYNSKQVEICRLGKDDGVGIQKLLFYSGHIDCQGVIIEDGGLLGVENYHYSISENDGLSLEDFKEWFKHYDLSKPLAIIHFTKFRY